MSQGSRFTIVVGLGGNLGDRIATLRAAAEFLEVEVPIVARSPFYWTTPVGGPPQPDFINAAVRLEETSSGTTEERVLRLLDHLQAIERRLGRVRDPHQQNAARVLDLDILWVGAASPIVLDGPRLVVPHPRLPTRAFALAPLVDVAPEACDPFTGAPYVVPNDPGVRLHLPWS